MTALAAEGADGMIPAMQAPEFTAESREQLGPDKLLIVGMANSAEPQEVADGVRQHLEAGADHVILMSSTQNGFQARTAEFEQLAAALS